MKHILILLALAAPAHAWPNSGKTLPPVVVPAGQHIANLSSDPTKNFFWELCSGPAKASREKQADGSVVWTVVCR